MKLSLLSSLLAGLLLLSGCTQPAAEARGGGGGTIDAINHTKWAINHFSVNGQSGIDIIGPFQGGGGGCCYGVPAQWKPGMTARIDWETGSDIQWIFLDIRTEKNILPGRKVLMRKKGSTAKPCPSLTTTTRTPAVSRCISCRAMTSRSPPAVTSTAALPIRLKSPSG